ncbi:hypothetical protein DFH28DRAFT_1094413 [Melampsora americana]|nr:hypothetical protein DFH28DRAFT_1094413 [Melampsora americana]
MSGQIHILTSAKAYITDRHRRCVHPLPPPIIGHLTGLTCPDCPLNSTRQLQYHPPCFPNPENINWKLSVNAGAQPPPPPGSLSGLLNISNKAPDHLKKNSTGQLCPGYLGKTGATHHSSSKSNMKCSNKLCLLCCQLGQRVHSLACNFKAHLYTPPSSDHLLSSPPIGSFIPFGQPITSTLTPSQLAEYHENIKAVDLVNKGREYAKREATKPGSSTLINAEAPNWPLFLLQESQIVIDKCRKGMSDTEDWESEIQVWNMEQFQWVSVAPMCTLNNCSGLSDAILKMTTEGPYEAFNTPACCILTKSPNPPTFKPSNSKLISPAPAVPRVNGTTTQTSAESETPNSPPPPSPRVIYSKPAEIKWVGSSMEPKGGADSPKLQPKVNAESKLQDLWDAWYNFFGETWILLVGEENLQIDKYHTEWLATRACNNKD